MSTQYRLVQSGKTASGGCSAGQGSSEPVASRIIIIIIMFASLDRNLEKLRYKKRNTQETMCCSINISFRNLHNLFVSL
jgi:hypothetical protein